MNPAEAFAVTPSGDAAKPGAALSFPYDRALVGRFRRRFPSARWHEGGWWWVPGTTAVTRLDRWIAEEADDIDRHGEARGRDAFQFEPVASRYLETDEDGLLIRTPFSRAVVRELRQVPWAGWDPEAKAWRVPWRSYEELKRRLPVIEAEAARAEPGARAGRKAAAPKPDAMTVRRYGDRRKNRYPVPGDDLPPEGGVVGTLFGPVIFEAFGVTLSAAEAEPYGFVDDPARFVWGSWRVPHWRDLRRAEPASDPDRSAGWSAPTELELDTLRDLLKRRIRRVSPATAASR